MADSTAEHAEIVVETALPFCVHELSILPGLISEGGGMSGGGRYRFVVGFLIIFLVLAGVLIVRSGALLVADLLLSGLLSDLSGLPSGLFLPAQDFSRCRSQ